MPRKSLEVNVEPNVFLWARKSVGLSALELGYSNLSKLR